MQRLVLDSVMTGRDRELERLKKELITARRHLAGLRDGVAGTKQQIATARELVGEFREGMAELENAIPSGVHRIPTIKQIVWLGPSSPSLSDCLAHAPAGLPPLYRVGPLLNAPSSRPA